MSYMILTTDEFSQYELILGFNGRPKIFNSENEALKYVTEMELDAFQIIKVTI